MWGGLWCKVLLWFVLVAGQVLPVWAGAPAPVREDFGFAEPNFDTIGQGKSPMMAITTMAQDAQGWLWFGTQKGLFRYDGYRMRTFLHDDADPASLSDNSVTALWAAADGRLWVGTKTGGVSVFDPHREQFSHIRHDPANPASLVDGRVMTILADGQGGFWIGTLQGLDHVSAAGMVLRHYRQVAGDPASLLDNRVYSLLLDRQQRLWVGTGAGLQRYQAATSGLPERWVAVASDPADPASLAGQMIRSLFLAQDGKLWIGTRLHGAAWLDPAQAEPVLQRLLPDPGRSDRLSHGWIDSICEPYAGQIWLATSGGGINIVNARDGAVLQQLRHKPAMADGLAHDTIGSMLVDESGILWIATWGGGLQRRHPAQQAYRVIRHNPVGSGQSGKPQGLSYPEVRSVLELADGRILLGTGGNGIDILTRRHGVIGGYRPQPGVPGGLPDGFIYSLLQTRDGTLWAGTRQAGVVRLAAGSRQWKSYALADGLPSLQVRTLLQDTNGILWAGTDNGIARWHEPSGRFIAEQQENGKALQIDAWNLAQDRQGRLWVGSNIGLWLKMPLTSGWRVFRSRPGAPNALPDDDVRGLLLDRNGRFWVATSKGLAFIRNQQWVEPVFEAFNADLDKADYVAGGGLWQDRQGRIWMGEDEVLVFDPHSLRFGYEARPDLGAVWHGAFTLTRDGLFIYGGSRGLAVFDPAQFRHWTFQPPVRVTEIKINGKPAAPAVLMPNLRLTPEQSNFSIEFSALDFFRSEKIRYRYRLKGYQKNWINTGVGHRVASYGNLWPGSYLLQVQASNGVGDWNRRLLEVPIVVLPAFWQTPWFVALLLFTLVGTLFGALRWRMARLRKQAATLREMVAQRTTEIERAHHELHQTHAELSGSHQQLASAHAELASAHQHLKQTQRQLVLQEKMAGLGTLTAGVAHEINNPTNFAHVAAQIQRERLSQFEQFVRQLLDEEADPEIVQEFAARFAELQGNVDTMLNGTERIRAIVKDLRSFTRLDEADKKTVHLSECLNATVNLVRTSWLEQVEFITEFVDDPPCECWAALLNQVFMNLLVNGCQAIAARRKHDGSTERGHLWLRLRQNGATLTVQIEDDGIGMSPELQQRILEPFFTTREVGSGSGMGLAISYGIIQKHGGTLEIASTPGRGSCFTLHLPLQG